MVAQEAYLGLGAILGTLPWLRLDLGLACLGFHFGFANILLTTHYICPIFYRKKISLYVRFIGNSYQFIMRPLTEEETKELFEKLSKYIGDNVKLLIDRPDGNYCFRLAKDRIFYVREGRPYFSHLEILR